MDVIAFLGTSEVIGAFAVLLGLMSACVFGVWLGISFNSYANDADVENRSSYELNRKEPSQPHAK